MEMVEGQTLADRLLQGPRQYAAQRAFGNTTLVEEDVRAAWGWMRLEQLGRDARYGRSRRHKQCRLIEKI